MMLGGSCRTLATPRPLPSPLIFRNRCRRCRPRCVCAGAGIRGLGYVLDSTKLKEIFADVDKDHDGEVTREQIATIAMPQLARFMLRGPEKAELAAPFAFFDKGTAAWGGRGRPRLFDAAAWA